MRSLTILVICFACAPACAQTPTTSQPLSFMDDNSGLSLPEPVRRDRTAASGSKRSRNRDRRTRLARMPKMYGDMLILGTAAIDDSGFGFDGITTYPIAGLSKVAENNSPIPQDRLFFIQNHFHNAVKTEQDIIAVGAVSDDAHVNRSTFGIEKTWLNDMASIEVRLPFLTTGDLRTASPLTTDNVNFDGVGLTLKALLYEGSKGAISCGLGSMIPVGDETTFTTTIGSYVIDSETFHLSPFLAASRQIGDNWFTQGFVQVDFPIDDDDVTATVTGTTFDAGSVAPPTLLHLDGSLGAWLYRNQYARFLTGFASMMELHYTRSISDVNTLSFEDPIPITLGDFTQGKPGGIELLNLTAGMHFEIRNQTTFRIAAVAPLLEGVRRAFDTEVQFQINRHF